MDVGQNGVMKRSTRENLIANSEVYLIGLRVRKCSINHSKLFVINSSIGKEESLAGEDFVIFEITDRKLFFLRWRFSEFDGTGVATCATFGR